MKKVALISGITGQDGAYLAKFLLKKNYIVHGIKRRSSTINTDRIDDIYEDRHSNKVNFFLHYGDVTDYSNIFNLIKNINPNEIYNLAAQSHVKVSFDTPIYTSNTNALGTLNFLEAIKTLNLKKIKFYQASTSEMFGNIKKKSISEKDKFNPVSPYGTSKLYSYWIVKNYRESYNIFASNGILFNHESPLRGETFVSRKITMNVAKRYHGYKEILYLGNIYSKRDWGHAADYVEGMWKMLQYKKSDDFILASNSTTTVKEFVNKAFSKIGINLTWKGKGIKEIAFDKKTKEIYVRIDKNYFRPNELNYLKGNASKAKKLLKWKQRYNLDKLIDEMVSKDIEKTI
tara:strand:+ start:160 stop:1194 length:1035 start_codon:yes stop_codon:yes gene_type:complete